MGDAQHTCLICQKPTEMMELYRVSFGKIVRCTGCGLVHVWPPRTSQQLNDLHTAANYFQHPYFDARRHPGRENFMRKNHLLLERIAGNQPLAGKKLLDVGCDTGSLLVVARDEFGMDVLGIEVSEAAAKVAVEDHKLTVKVGDIIMLNLPENTFDMITAIDVIEHLSEPDKALEKLQTLLAPGGKLFISTADHDALINTIGLAMYRALGKYSMPVIEKLYIPFHEFYFTRPTLARLVEQAGFQIVRHAGTEFPLDEFGHGLVFKMGLIPIFALQKLVKRQTLQELLAVKI